MDHLGTATTTSQLSPSVPYRSIRNQEPLQPGFIEFKGTKILVNDIRRISSFDGKLFLHTDS